MSEEATEKTINKKVTRENKKFERSHFDVLGICCSSEIPLIENILKPLEGIKQITVIVPTRTLIVVHDSLLISQLQIVKALNEARLEANIQLKGKGIMKKKWPSPYAIASGLLLTASFLKYVYHPLRWLAVAAVAAGIFPILLKAISAIRHLRIDVNILAIIAVVGTIAMEDYMEAGSIVFLFSIAEWLESRASQKANGAMSSLMRLAPQKATIAESGEVVDVRDVKLKSVLSVKAGEVIPIDGIVVEGNCEVDEKTLSGETFPVTKQKDSLVWAGTINLNGYVSVQTTVVAEDCVVAKMAELVEEAQKNKSKTQTFIDECAKYYTPAVIIISACLAAIPAALRVHNLSHWLHLALVVLVSACPCALILSTPVAAFCALTKAAMAGVLIKGGNHLEVLAKIKVMAFDKTGTITRGEFVVTHFQALRDDISFNTLLQWVSSIESKSSHPMATALVNYGKLHSIDLKPENVEEFENFPGEGVRGKIDGNDIYIGSKKIAARAGYDIPVSSELNNFDDETRQEQTLGYVFCGGTIIGSFGLLDSCRSGVKEAIEEIKSFGIKTAMLTGDCRAAAMHVQEQLGNNFEVIHSELLPKEKANIIKEFKKNDGAIAMVGDGLNDTPALATADIGMSMGISGSALATETGNVILMSNDMRKIPKVIKLAKTFHTKVVQNVILSIGTKTAILGLAFAGHPLIWAAVLADVGTCLLVILNSMLLLRGTDHKHGKKKCCKSSKPCLTKHGQLCDGTRSSHHHDHHDHHNHRCHVVDDQSTSRVNNHVHKHCCYEEKDHKIQLSQDHNRKTCGVLHQEKNHKCGDHECKETNVHHKKEHKFHHNYSNDCEKTPLEKEITGNSSKRVGKSDCNCRSHHVAIDIHESNECERVVHK
ncbi:putative inactive cadmium/zinc-transporting ATPase HMA3 isoform X1 [Cucumis melo]|uniref:Inactive cadmium/zinc-transporting ATPase HMA3 isoform X1 n=1 Tax=Cucumis melo TaxID=3656 RepID=A0A1S3BSI1_CUCME|nr:putative inactive cadmium/zinc-transporting ATPase HMA3 isoform X1 [Cucumis melo]